MLTATRLLLLSAADRALAPEGQAPIEDLIWITLHDGLLRERPTRRDPAPEALTPETDQALKHKVAAIDCLTDGAKRLASDAADLEGALQVALTDKGFRAFLRSRAKEGRPLAMLNEVIASGSAGQRDLDVAAARAELLQRLR